MIARTLTHHEKISLTSFSLSWWWNHKKNYAQTEGVMTLADFIAWHSRNFFSSARADFPSNSFFYFSLPIMYSRSCVWNDEAKHFVIGTFTSLFIHAIIESKYCINGLPRRSFLKSFYGFGVSFFRRRAKKSSVEKKF